MLLACIMGEVVSSPCVSIMHLSDEPVMSLCTTALVVASCTLLQVHIVSQAVGHTEGEAMFRYYPAMPGNSTCCVREKEQLQREHMAAHFFADSQDCICPVTTISHLMDQHGVHEVNLLKVRLHQAVRLTSVHLVLQLAHDRTLIILMHGTIFDALHTALAGKSEASLVNLFCSFVWSRAVGFRPWYS